MFKVNSINLVEKEAVENNLKEFSEMADYALSKQKYNAAVTLYYKALVEICDLELLKKLNKIGSNHTERFELLEKASPVLYGTASKLFRYYRDTYNKELSKTIAELFKKEVENARKIVLGN